MTVAIDTSVAVPLLVQTHAEHAAVTRWSRRREISLAGHALAETYSVLTRLPADIRLSPGDAARLLRARFAAPLALSETQAHALPETLSSLGISGGAVYDALVALAARQHHVSLATRDARARGTYDAVGVPVILIP